MQDMEHLLQNKTHCLQKLWWGSLTLWYIKPASNTYSLMCFLAWIKIKQNQHVDLLASCKHLVEKRKCSSYHPGMRNGHCVNVPVTKREKERHKETGQDRRGAEKQGAALFPTGSPRCWSALCVSCTFGILQPRARAVAVALRQGPEKATDCTGAIREPQQCSGTGFSGRLLTNSFQAPFRHWATFRGRKTLKFSRTLA